MSENSGGLFSVFVAANGRFGSESDSLDEALISLATLFGV